MCLEPVTLVLLRYSLAFIINSNLKLTKNMFTYGYIADKIIDKLRIYRSHFYRLQ